jgi:hypothetical protein
MEREQARGRHCGTAVITKSVPIRITLLESIQTEASSNVSRQHTAERRWRHVVVFDALDIRGLVQCREVKVVIQPVFRVKRPLNSTPEVTQTLVSCLNIYLRTSNSKPEADICRWQMSQQTCVQRWS